MEATSQTRFDEMSGKVAAAYAAGDVRSAQRLADALCAQELFPRFRRLSFLRGYVPELREDVVAHALLRVVGDWRRGKTVTWATLERIFVNAAIDVTAQHRKLPTVHAGDDDDARESFYASEGAEVAQPGDPLDEVLDAIEIEELAVRMQALGRPTWAAYVRAWHQGYQTGPDIAHSTGIKPGRVRQIRMDLCQFLQAYHPQVARSFGCVGSAMATPVPGGSE